MQLGDQQKDFAPHTICKQCVNRFSMWANGKPNAFTFTTPMAWREQNNHLNDCYFCSIEVKGLKKKKIASDSQRMGQ